MEQIEQLNPGYSTTKLVSLVKPNIVNRPEDKFESYLFWPQNPDRKGEGGLRRRGYFKYSYKIKNFNTENEKWYACNWEGEELFEIERPEALKDNSFLKGLTKDKNEIELPLVTVITVVLNGEKYLEETIQSVINQTYPNVEYIIIDGGSTDGTLNIIKKYEDAIDYWISEPDKGIYDAMNKGIQLATGKIIGILNSDDYYERDAIKISLEKVLTTGSDYSFGNVKFVSGGIIKPIYPLYKKVYQEMPYPHVSAFIRLSVYKSVGLFDTSLKIAGDHDMALRIILMGYRYCYVNKFIAILRRGGISDSVVSNRESLYVTIKNGKNKFSAYFTYFIQILKYIIRSILPDPFIKFLMRLKGSRFYG